MTRTNIPNYYNIEKITQKSNIEELQNTEASLDTYFKLKVFTVEDIYTIYNLLIKYKRLANTEYKIKKEENTII